MLRLSAKNLHSFKRCMNTFSVSKISSLNSSCLNINMHKAFQNNNFVSISKFNFSEDKKNSKQNKGKSEKVEKNEKKDKKNNEKESSVSVSKTETKEDIEDEDFDNDKYVAPHEYIEKSADIFRAKVPFKNEKYKIEHKYENRENVKKTPQVTKKSLENIVTQLLRNEEVTTQRAEEMKTELRDPLNNAYGRHLTKIKSRVEAMEYIQTFSDLHFYNTTYESFDRLMRYQREMRDEEDPAYIQIRSQHKLVKNEDMMFLDPETKDVRQNVNSPDWLKTQPRMTSVGYNYNSEEHREFHKMFPKYVEEDKQKTIEKQKLMKYIKLNSDTQQVKLRFLSKYLPNGVTPDKIPDYDVDITGFTPEVTKKSRRKYKTPRVDTNFKNYEVWRCFDRIFHSFNHDYPCRFGHPGVSQHPDFTGMFYFEDENLDLFLVGDHMQTQETWGPNYVDEYYEIQEKTVKPEWREKKWPDYDEFWNMTEPREFKIYHSKHSELPKFRRWLKVHVNYFNSETDKTLDQILDEKFGKIDDYTDYSLKRENNRVPAIYNYSPKYFMGKDEKILVDHDPFVPPKYISPQEGEVFSYDEFLREEAKKGLKRDKGELGEDSLNTF